MSGCHSNSESDCKVSKLLTREDLDPLIDILRAMNDNMLRCRLEIEEVRQLLRED